MKFVTAFGLVLILLVTACLSQPTPPPPPTPTLTPFEKHVETLLARVSDRCKPYYRDALYAQRNHLKFKEHHIWKRRDDLSMNENWHQENERVKWLLNNGQREVLLHLQTLNALKIYAFQDMEEAGCP